jgi:hypothetical protein
MNCHDGGRRRRRAQRVYRRLVWLYPAAHRRAFGEQMVQAFGDHYRDVVEEHGGSRLRFWLAALGDVGTSVVTEYAGRPRTRTNGGRRRGAQKRRAARRLQYKPVRLVIRTRRRRLVYRGRRAALIALAVLIGLALGTGAATGHLGIGALLTGLAVAVWLAYSLRLSRPVPAGPRGDGPAPPGGASVREPRRPLPLSPSGVSARPCPDQDGPGQAVACV